MQNDYMSYSENADNSTLIKINLLFYFERNITSTTYEILLRKKKDTPLVSIYFSVKFFFLIQITTFSLPLQRTEFKTSHYKTMSKIRLKRFQMI